MTYSSAKPSLAALAITALSVSIFIFYIHAGRFDLYADEAQYWSWAQFPAWGYYSKPPFVAWLIMVTTSVCGESEFCIRLGSPITHGLTALTIFMIGRELYTPKVALWSLVTYLAMPAIVVSAGIITTDPPLLLFWSLSLYCFIKATRRDSFLWWCLTGLVAGLGCLSKYNMVIFLPSAIWYLLLCGKEGKRQLFSSKFILAGVIAAVIYLPNFLWNMDNHFVSYLHTKEISGVARHWGHPLAMLQFILCQVGVFGPVCFSLLALIAIKGRNLITSDPEKLLICFTLPFFLVILLVSFISKAEPNWAAPMYVAGTVLVVSYACNRGWSRWLVISLCLHLALMGFYYNFYPAMRFVGVKQFYTQTGVFWKRDPFYRFKGYHQLGETLSERLKEHPYAVLLCDDRKLLAEMLYYVHPHPFNALKLGVNLGIRDQYDLTRPLPVDQKGVFMFLSPAGNDSVAELGNKFSSVKALPVISMPLYPDYQPYYKLYRVQR